MSEQPPLSGSGGPPESAVMLVILTGRALETRVNEALKAHGLSLRQLGVLGHLAGSPELSYTDLARRARVTVQSMHTTVAALVGLGAVRAPDSGRGRAAVLELTERGHELVRAGRTVVAELDGELAAALPAEDSDRLADDLLTILRAAAPARS